MQKIIKKLTSTLFAFLKYQCANYDNHYNICISSDKACRVFDGIRCGYFEKCVLAPNDYKYRVSGYDYAKLFAQYAEQTKAKRQLVKQRRCDCGEPLQYRQKYCDFCRKKRAKEANRRRQQKYRFSNSLVVTL